jgi:hypothetical protein
VVGLAPLAGADPVTLPALLPGDVLIVRTTGGWWARLIGRLIRFGAATRDQPNMDDHVAIVHHVDPAGTLWVIEGRPGGVGWASAQQYDNPYLLHNAEQPKTQDQRDEVCALAVGLLGTPYDWSAIVADGMAAIGAGTLWRSKDFGDGPPAHVVCSSLAAWLYHRVSLAEPDTTRRVTTPGDWADWVLRRGWQPR